MCGRFYVDDETAQEIEQIARQIDARLMNNRQVTTITPSSTHDVYPSQNSSVLLKKEDHLVLDNLKWGFPRYQQKGCVINARSETICNSRMFKSSVESRRCVIPARGFYEWDKDKIQYQFEQKEHGILLLAGIYNIFENVTCYVIITTACNESMKDIHDRIPLILNRDEISKWLLDENDAVNLLNKKPDLLYCNPISGYVQQKLDL